MPIVCFTAQGSVANASIAEAGHEKVKCKAYIRQVAMPYIKTSYGFEGKGCGLCQTGVPCESKIPIAKDAE